MKISYDFSEYKPWSGAVSTYEKIEEAGKLDDLEYLLDDMFNGCADAVQVNDLLWFDSDIVLESLGLKEEDDDDI